MAFIQIIDFRTKRIEEGQALVEAYRAATADRSKVQRGLLCQDRDDPERYVNIVFFDSYEEAMENSNLPETNELAGKLAELSEGPASFLNLEVMMDME